MKTFTSAKKLPKQVPAFPQDLAVLKAVFARVRAAYPSVSGLTHVTDKAAVFQVFGDPTRYCCEVTADEAKALGFINL